MNLILASRARPVMLSVLSVVGCSLLAAPASADLILTGASGTAGASTTYVGFGPPNLSDQKSFGPFGGVAIAEVGRNRAVQTGSGLNAVNVEATQLSDILGFAYHAETDIDWQVQNTGPAAANLIFDYTINGGELRLIDAHDSFQNLTATVAVSIFVIAPGFNGFLWEWGVTLHTGAAGAPVVDEHGFATIFSFHDPLGLGRPALSPVTVAGGAASVSIAPFTTTVDLGKLGIGGTALISYTMYADISGGAVSVRGAKASLGDPFDVQNQPGSALSVNGVAAPVPEPSLMMLTLAGAVAVMRRRRVPRRR